MQEQTTQAIAIRVNGERMECRAETLSALLDHLGYRDVKVATALNGEFVAATQRQETRLSHDDQVEIVAPRQGG